MILIIRHASFTTYTIRWMFKEDAPENGPGYFLDPYSIIILLEISMPSAFVNMAIKIAHIFFSEIFYSGNLWLAVPDELFILYR